ncbi:MAG: helix-turn-helix transcriptional regulator [Streptomyces sp.]|nr:helix-turn-helix transcriptional regulator [Streptomyces sp.]
MTEPRRDRISIAVAQNVTRLRQARGWHLRDLSDRTARAGKRVGISSLSRIENARDGHKPHTAVSVDDLVALAAAFEVPVDQLLTVWEPNCAACMDKPPTGFACRACGAEA